MTADASTAAEADNQTEGAHKGLLLIFLIVAMGRIMVVGGHSSIGRAPSFQVGGFRFETGCPLHYSHASNLYRR